MSATAKRFSSDIDLGGNKIMNVLMDPGASDPVSLADGQVWYNSTSGHLFVRAGGSTFQLDQQTAAMDVLMVQVFS